MIENQLTEIQRHHEPLAGPDARGCHRPTRNARSTLAEYATAAAARDQLASLGQGKTTAEHGLSAEQQAIPLIASFAAKSDMPKLNAALNHGLDVTISIGKAVSSRLSAR
jgi:hypothetical protein